MQSIGIQCVMYSRERARGGYVYDFMACAMACFDGMIIFLVTQLTRKQIKRFLNFFSRARASQLREKYVNCVR